jgi:hypothetical protein
MTRQFAQTNIQLYNQMRDAEYTLDEVKLVARAYNYATTIFVGLYRGSGKTLLAHLVGTGSIVAWLHRPAPVIAASILHAAYENGDFGGAQPEQDIAKAVGEEVGRFVYSYHNLRWSYQTRMVDDLIQRMPGLDTYEREATLMRIANEMEDYLDGATWYHGLPGDHTQVKGAEWRVAYMDRIEEPMVTLAKALGEPALAEELTAQFAQARSTRIPEELRSGHPYMSFVAPRSYQRKPSAQLRRAQRLVKRVRTHGLADTVQAARKRMKATSK